MRRKLLGGCGKYAGDDHNGNGSQRGKGIQIQELQAQAGVRISPQHAPGRHRRTILLKNDKNELTKNTLKMQFMCKSTYETTA